MSYSGSGDTHTTATASIEVSVPTDLTVTSEGDSEEHKQSHVKRQARDLHFLTSEKNHFHLINEKLQLELREKEAQLGAFKAQHEALLNQKNLQNEIKLSEKQSHINRLEAELISTREELQLFKERAAKELANLLQKCLNFQQVQSRLIVKYDEVKSSISKLNVTEEEFVRLRNIPRDQLNLQEFAQLRVYEIELPYKAKIRELEAVKASLQNALSTCERELQAKCRELSKGNEDMKVLRDRIHEYSSECEELRKETKLNDYRVHNFDRIKRERDHYEEENLKLEKLKSEAELAASVFRQEKKTLSENLAEMKSKLRTQEQELNKYKNEYFDTKNQLDRENKDQMKTTSRLRLEQERNDDIHERFLKAKTDIISLSENLQDASNEVKSLKERCREISESEKEAKKKLNELHTTCNELQTQKELLESKSRKENNGLKLEITELRASYNALLRSYNETLDNNAKLLKENEYRKNYLQDEKDVKDKEFMKIRQENYKLSEELKEYKALEDDYLSTLKVFASVSEQGTDGRGNYCPASSIVKGKLAEQTISLTRRILHLERQNAEACSTLKKLTDSLEQMGAKLSSYKSALGMVGKPYEQIVEKVRDQEEQILLLEEALKTANDSRNLLVSDMKSLQEQLKMAKSHLEDATVKRNDIVALKDELSELRKKVLHNNSDNKAKYSSVPSAITITKAT